MKMHFTTSTYKCKENKIFLKNTNTILNYYYLLFQLQTTHRKVPIKTRERLWITKMTYSEHCTGSLKFQLLRHWVMKRLKYVWFWKE